MNMDARRAIFRAAKDLTTCVSYEVLRCSQDDN